MFVCIVICRTMVNEYRGKHSESMHFKHFKQTSNHNERERDRYIIVIKLVLKFVRHIWAKWQREKKSIPNSYNPKVSCEGKNMQACYGYVQVLYKMTCRILSFVKTFC